MDLEHQATLYRSYPLFFRRPRLVASSKHPIDHWGIECGDGWYKLINEVVASKLETHIEKRAESGVQKAKWPRPTQIKEKFGTLQIHLINTGDRAEEIADLVQAANLASAVTCEYCGNTGTLRRTTDGIYVCCHECVKKEGLLGIVWANPHDNQMAEAV